MAETTEETETILFVLVGLVVAYFVYKLVLARPLARGQQNRLGYTPGGSTGGGFNQYQGVGAQAPLPYAGQQPQTGTSGAQDFASIATGLAALGGAVGNVYSNIAGSSTSGDGGDSEGGSYGGTETQDTGNDGSDDTSLDGG